MSQHLQILDAARDLIILKLKNKQFFKALIEQLNENIDLPMIGEKTEKKVFKAMIKTVIQALEKVDLDAEDEVEESDAEPESAEPPQPTPEEAAEAAPCKG